MLVHPRATHLGGGLIDGGRLQGASHGLGCARVRARQKRVAMLVRVSIASPRPEGIGNLRVVMVCKGSVQGAGLQDSWRSRDGCFCPALTEDQRAYNPRATHLWDGLVDGGRVQSEA